MKPVSYRAWGTRWMDTRQQWCIILPRHQAHCPRPSPLALGSCRVKRRRVVFLLEKSRRCICILEEQFLKLSFSNPLRPSASVPACCLPPLETSNAGAAPTSPPAAGCTSSDHMRWDELQSTWRVFIIALLLAQNGRGPAQISFHRALILRSGPCAGSQQVQRC
ncbi:uncharacterized protein LOC142414397 isoform X2 [Mycteria americana]|uniref:uncharacterized protein LOC142414397 isoform X2 n=1 Tax=Mycteria americana TaxID=33587 RepID=UPI003F5818E5